MSLNPEELAAHCTLILKSIRIKNKIVILCEGDIRKVEDRPSPQTYGKMEQMPDANFYKACVPRAWRNSRPEFFNCGDRNDVINTYFALQDYHQADPINSFLNTEKLFALIDLDLQKKTIEYEYTFQSTEDIFFDLYCKGCTQEDNVSRHRIWTTGLIYKEAYFLFPDLQKFFAEHNAKPTYKSQPVLLRDLYCDMADAIPSNADMCGNLETIQNRLSHCEELEFSNPEALRQSWTQSFQSASDETQRHRLTTALLTIKPVKPFWKNIQPPPDWTSGSDGRFREQLSLDIGRFYADQTDTQRYHLVAFFKALQSYL
jgi:hypothetical protein